MSTKIFMHDISIISSIGSELEQTLDHLLNGVKRFQKTNAYSNEIATPLGLVTINLPNLPKKFQCFDSKNSRLSLLAIQKIEKACEAVIAKYGRDRVALIAGSSTSGIQEGENAVTYFNEHQKFPEQYSYQQHEMGSVSEFLFSYLNLESFHYTVSTACSSSANIFQSAKNALTANLCDAVILVSADTISKLTVQGFQSLEAVSTDECKPFSKDRDGINLGEGAAACILSKEPDGQKISVAGVGTSSDAHHMSAPHPEGSGAKNAMLAALEDAKVSADAIAYINLHGTSTILNDAMESKAVYALFTDKTPCSSTKALTGHTLGASGLIEACFCWLIMSDLNQNRLLPMQPNFSEIDPSIAAINIINKKTSLQKNGIFRFLSNSFAFGGNNCSIILERCKDE